MLISKIIPEELITVHINCKTAFFLTLKPPPPQKTARALRQVYLFAGNFF